MQKRKNREGILIIVVVLVAAFCLAELNPAFGQRSSSRRSQRVRMEQVEVAGPDGKVKLTVLGNAERLTLTVTMGDVTVLGPSTILMNLDGYDLSTGVVLGDVERYEINETYPWHGAKSTAVNRCNGARISLQNDLSFIDYILEIRVFNDGATFRHIIPGDENASRIPDEYTAFVILEGSTVWYHDLGDHYEAAYKKSDISDVRPGQWMGPPVTFELPDGAGYGSITEANLVNYSGMALEADGRRGLVTGLGHRQPLNYPYELRYGREEAKRLGKPAAVSGTITTPWRVVMAGRDLNTLVNSTIVPNLCPGPDLKYFPDGIKTDWVKPGRAVWRYLDGGDRSFEGMKEFSRMAGQLGYEYHILEGFWSRWSDEQIKEIAEYSKQQGAGLLFWRHSNRLGTAQEREEFFSRLHSLGVAGTKIDFLDHEAKEVVDHYEALLEKSAEYKMVVNFHGANKPTGRARTWPNEIVREAVRGMESSSLRERARHETILPFARFLAGHADYTTMHFGERRQDSTWAHQIASLAIFASPLLTVAAHPKAVLDNPAVDVIKSIPAVWDETIVLPESKIGELAIFARRTGDIWFLAVMCGPQARTIRVPLSFLGGGQYKAAIVFDNKDDAAAVVTEDRTVRQGDMLTIEMINGGGFVGRFSK
ncbi:MAG: glycoside hydrolase family 97 N-terminal domain-containing protein [Planctomycetes bacterium]|nr:glycoside hydrolase family 97 N-terminal domain-containing protein [Planctomycetota bacterium]MBL7145218.1 glycoside hydrolase family 97 N-terminal domain-containing protein [Phycisphaerae bacterium]